MDWLINLVSLLVAIAAIGVLVWARGEWRRKKDEDAEKDAAAQSWIATQPTKDEPGATDRPIWRPGDGK